MRGYRRRVRETAVAVAIAVVPYTLPASVQYLTGF
jgi:hypothetical protein